MVTHRKDDVDKDKLKSALASMLGDMRWETLRQILETRKKFRRRFQMGGFQLKAQHTERARSVLLKAIEEADHTRFFLSWCREKADYKPIMDAWFELRTSEEQSQNEDEETPSISDELFEKLRACLKGQDGLFFLFLSPIVFSEEQEEQLLHPGSDETKQSDGEKKPEVPNSVSSDRSKAELKELRSKLKEREREDRKRVKQCEQLQSQIRQLSEKTKELDNSNRQLEEQIVKLENMENQRIEALESEVERNKKVMIELTTKQNALETEIEQKTSELARTREEKESLCRNL